MTASGPLELVELIDEEFVAGRGSVEVVWLVSKGDGWVRAASAPGAQRERLDAGPGTVWRSRIRLELPRGSRVLRVESRPRVRASSTLDHLMGGSGRSSKRVERAAYRVLRGGKLGREAAD